MSRDRELLQAMDMIVTYLRSAGSAESKVRILKRYDHEDIKRLLQIIYDDHYVLNITADRISSESWMDKTTYTSIFDLLQDLHERKITGNSALTKCCEYASTYPYYAEVIYSIFDKDLNCGIGPKTINKAFPGLIKDFKGRVPLANTYKKGMCKWGDETWFASRKLDGVRCLAFVSAGSEIKMLSRTGKEFFTLNKIKRELIKNFPVSETVVLDGEVCIVDDKGNEKFDGIMSEIRRKNHTIQNPKFFVFDFYTADEFYGMKNISVPYSDRIENVTSLISTFGYRHIEALPQWPITKREQIVEMVENLDPKWEGLILRKNETNFKRSNALLKVKNWKDAEYRVACIKIGLKTISGVEQECVAGLEVVHKGNLVTIGSGLSDQQRLDWYHKPELIMGKIITVKYFAESKNKEGAYSLRFPILKAIRDYE